tara:strand:+ start:2793 stop:3413 length:621 start_codon:yes stop_codon:yes gene_type:complete
VKFLNFNKVLCLGAHPDDVEYGMLGSMCKFTDTKFDILVLSEGGDFDKSTGKDRQTECKNIWNKISNVNGEFTDVKHVVNHQEDEWVNILESGGYISTDYDCIFTLPSKDSHFEHRIVNSMTPALVRHKKIGIISYRTPSTLDNWISNFYVEINLNEKMDHLKEFKSQLSKPYFSKNSLNSFHSNYQCFKKNIEYVELFRVEIIYN